jgi:hypothetical protein
MADEETFIVAAIGFIIGACCYDVFNSYALLMLGRIFGPRCQRRTFTQMGVFVR